MSLSEYLISILKDGYTVSFKRKALVEETDRKFLFHGNFVSIVISKVIDHELYKVSRMIEWNLIERETAELKEAYLLETIKNGIECFDIEKEEVYTRNE